jgi:hypothetical protein
LHPKHTTNGLVHIREHPWCWDKPRATWTHLTHHGSDSGEATTFPHIVFFAALRRGYIRMALFPGASQSGVPKLSQFTLTGLWASITSCSDLRLGWGLRQSCSSLQNLSNAMLHSTCRRQDRVDSRLLVVGSQTASLTPGPSFAHNLSCRCPNDSCEAILDIYTSRPFQWHKKHLNTRCFDPCNRVPSFRKSRRTPTSHFWECEFHPHTYPKVGLRHV